VVNVPDTYLSALQTGKFSLNWHHIKIFLQVSYEYRGIPVCGIIQVIDCFQLIMYS